jgi:hypothetical protein
MPVFIAILGSGVIAALIGLIPQYFPRSPPPPPPPTFEWVKAGVPANDCSQQDTGQIYARAMPPQYCSVQDKDTIAVCWDGMEYKNALNPRNDASLPWCSYKAVKPDQCKEGRFPGVIWTCIKD